MAAVEDRHMSKTEPGAPRCAQCNSELHRASFRTGSVKQPGRNTLVCNVCGIQQETAEETTEEV